MNENCVFYYVRFTLFTGNIYLRFNYEVMMIFNYDGNRYVFARFENEHGHRVNTMCCLYGASIIGESRLHPKDASKFNKALGKVIAFSKGLQSLGYSRDYRIRAMNAFLDVLYQ